MCMSMFRVREVDRINVDLDSRTLNIGLVAWHYVSRLGLDDDIVELPNHSWDALKQGIGAFPIKFSL